MPDWIPRPATDKGRATRERIVRAAADLMYAGGVSTTSLDDIRAAAGVSGSQVTHYFGNRRELIREVIAARQRETLAFHAADRFDGFTNFRAFEVWAHACVETFKRTSTVGGCVYGSLVGELVFNADEALCSEIADGYDGWLTILQLGFSAMRDRGQLRADADPRHLAAVLVCAHQGSAAVSQTLADTTPAHVALGAAVAYVRSFSSGS
jgi:TetR/AcrR family transcriptional regulator, transcriptional repressor for nem operon